MTPTSGIPAPTGTIAPAPAGTNGTFGKTYFPNVPFVQRHGDRGRPGRHGDRGRGWG